MQVDRTCPLCGKVFAYPCLLKRHIQNRKKPCITIQNVLYKCEGCGKEFTRADNLQKHKRQHCPKLSRAQDTGEIHERLDKILELINARDQQPTIQNNFNTMVVLNNFGFESVDHISRQWIFTVLRDIFKNIIAQGNKNVELTDSAIVAAASEVLQAVIKKVYANPAVPENLTTYIPNKRTDSVMFYQEGWQQAQLNEIMPSIRGRILDVLQKGQPIMGEVEQKSLQDYGKVVKGVFELDAKISSGLVRDVIAGNKELLQSLNMLDTKLKPEDIKL